MFSKTKLNKIAGGTSLLLLLTGATSVTAYSNPSELSFEELRSKLRLINPKGNTIQNVSPLYNPLHSNYYDVNVRQGTWGDFIGLASNNYNVDVEFLLKYNNSRKEMVMTKDEIYDSLRLIIESAEGIKLNGGSQYKLRTTIHSFNVGRNYLLKADLDYLLNRDFLVSPKGDMIETALVKVISGEEGVLEVSRIRLGSVSSKERYKLRTSDVWRNEHNIYEINIIGDSITSLSPKENINYGVVKIIDNQLFVEDLEIDYLYANEGDFVEYVKIEDKVHILENYGDFEESLVVESVDSKRIETYEDESIRKSDTIVDINGREINSDSIERNSVISVFDDIMIIHEEKSEHNLRVNDEEVFIDNIPYPIKDIWVSIGSGLHELEDYSYKEYINKGTVTWDVLGNPKIIKSEQIERVVNVTDYDDDYVYGTESDGDFEYELSSSYGGDRLRRGNVYKFIVVDKEVVDGERLNSSYDNLDRLYSNRLYVRGRRYNVEDDTLVIVENSDGNEGLKEIDYSELYEEYEEKILNGDMDVEVFYEDRGHALMLKVTYFPIEGMDRDNWLNRPPLDIYKVVDIDRSDRNIRKIILSDGDNEASFTTYDRDLVENISNGDYVTAFFSKKGNLYDMYTFELTKDIITHKKMNEYMDFFSIASVSQNVIADSGEAMKLRSENLFYKDVDGTLVSLGISEELIPGNRYIILQEGKLTVINAIE